MIAPLGSMNQRTERVYTRSRREPSEEPSPALQRASCDDGAMTLPVAGRSGAATSVTARQMFWLRVLFALDVIGAGAPGVLLLVQSAAAIDWFFAGGAAPGPATSMLGCLWLAMGALAVAGLFRPVALSPLFVLQLIYKGCWLAFVAAPALSRGEAFSPIVAGVFLAWTVAVAITVPWRALFARDFDASEAIGVSHRVLPRKPAS
jgi:hypothetical protein